MLEFSFENNYSFYMVYLAKDYKSGLIKIGYSKNPIFREQTLRAENPMIDIFCIILGDRYLEKYLHDKYQDFRIRGEWFKLCTEQIKEITSTHQIIFQKSSENFLTDFAARLLDIILEDKKDYYLPNYLAHNLFSDCTQLRKSLDELKRKKIIKYKWKDFITIELK